MYRVEIENNLKRSEHIQSELTDLIQTRLERFSLQTNFRFRMPQGNIQRLVNRIFVKVFAYLTFLHAEQNRCADGAIVRASEQAADRHRWWWSGIIETLIDLPRPTKDSVYFTNFYSLCARPCYTYIGCVISRSCRPATPTQRF